MKYLINLLLEIIGVLFLFNIMVMLIPKGIRRGFNGTFHLFEIIFNLLLDIILSTTTLVKEQVFSYFGIKKKPTRQKPSKKQSNKVINLSDKANKG